VRTLNEGSAAHMQTLESRRPTCKAAAANKPEEEVLMSGAMHEGVQILLEFPKGLGIQGP
jgi:hypothetical protein